MSEAIQFTRELQAEETPFCQTVPKLQKAWDNTSISILKECPRKYQYTILEGWRANAKAGPLVFGGLFHNGLEVYDIARAKGAPHDEALRLAVRHALLESCVLEADGVWRDNLAACDDTLRTRPSLIRAIVWYCEHYRDDAVKTYILPDGTPALELSFRFELPITSPDHDSYLYVGHIDKLGTMGSDLYNVERKHTGTALSSAYFARYTPNGQVSGYEFAGRVVLDRAVSGTIIDATQIAAGFVSFGRGITPRTEEYLEDWLNNTMHWIGIAEHYASQNYWPMNEESCHKYSGCAFRDICSKSPSTRQKWLEAHYHKDPWNPLRVRGGEVAEPQSAKVETTNE